MSRMLASEAISLKCGICSVKSIPDFGFMILKRKYFLLKIYSFLSIIRNQVMSEVLLL